MQLGDAHLPEGLRVYAIGDVHGCDHLLAEVHDKIAADLKANPPDSYRVIHLGDYIDRGPDSAAVIDRLSNLCDRDTRIVCLRGNHEQMLLDAIGAKPGSALSFLANGGTATLASYGVEPDDRLEIDENGTAFSQLLASKLPPHHRILLEGTRYSIQFGDFYFCHAGVRPGIQLKQQNPVDLTWIRKEFLESSADFGAVVVHGHTPSSEPEIRSNRINIDTGAALGGKLTCLVLEQHEYRFL